MKSKLLVLTIAMACHAANKVYCESHGDDSQKDWNEAEDWQKKSAVKGVEYRLNNPHAGHDAQHNSWMQEKLNEGWKYGEVKDAEAKTHPCIVPFEELPVFQQKKDALFCAIVDAHVNAEKEFNEGVPTYGMKAVGANFNPSGNQSVNECKKRFADQIDQLNEHRNDFMVPAEGKRLASIAITEAQGAQMWAVKALTYTE